MVDVKYVQGILPSSSHGSNSLVGLPEEAAVGFGGTTNPTAAIGSRMLWLVTLMAGGCRCFGRVRSSSIVVRFEVGRAGRSSGCLSMLVLQVSPTLMVEGCKLSFSCRKALPYQVQGL